MNDMLSKIGGFSSSVMKIFKFLIEPITSYLFYIDLIGFLFFCQDEDYKAPEKKENKSGHHDNNSDLDED